MTISPLILVVAGLACGIAGYLIRQVLAMRQKNSSEAKIAKSLADTKQEAKEILLEAKDKAVKILEEAKEEEKTRLQEVRKNESRLLKREEALDLEMKKVSQKGDELNSRVEQIKSVRDEIEKVKTEVQKNLERAAKLSESEAKEELLKEVQKKYDEDLKERLEKLERRNTESFEKRGREILTTVIQRLASPTTSEVTTTVVNLPNEDLKGRIIGREGRNIRTLERLTGVEVIVDDTPETIVISGFDPVRRQIAKTALENLIADGRIQPARIEEMVEKAKQEIDDTMKQAAEEAAYDVGILDLDPRLMKILGRLKFRTSYGQNVLAHSIEMAHIAGMLAAELGADVLIAKKGALLHDIGKALDHEVQGSHVEIGRRILQKFSVDERIIKAMQAHHGEYPYETLESIIVQTADAISGSRPGARRDTIENYLKRLEELEQIAKSFEGVEKSYAIQAGREIRIFVTPEKLGDAESKLLARSIADKIQQELRYPGEIKVTLIREMRVIEYAK